MKSCLGLIFVLLVFTVVIGGGALIWYLSSSAELSKNGGTPAGGITRPAATR